MSIREGPFRWTTPRVRRTCDVEEYTTKLILDNVIPRLVEHDPHRALEILVKALLRVQARDASKHGTFVSSGVWRPAIESTRTGYPIDEVDQLIDAVWNIGGLIGSRDPMARERVLDLLNGYRSPLLARIATRLLSEWYGTAPARAAAALRDEEQLDAFLREYSRLLSQAFPHFDSSTQAQIVDLITSGLPPSAASSVDAHSTRAARYWTYKRLAAIEAQLAPEQVALVAELRSEFGDLSPEREDRGIWIGPTSPLTTDQVKAMAPHEVADRLATWIPPAGFMVDTPEGLARHVTEAVRARPREYADQASLFSGLHATYVRGLIAGLRNAVSEGAQISWGPVLDVAQEAVSRERSDPGTFPTASSHRYGDADPDWGWARKEIASLLEVGVTQSSSGLTAEFAGDVWLLLRDLAEDPEPDQRYESQYGMKNSDWSTLALNTVRPATFLAIHSYWVWISGVAPDFPMQADVKATLAAHLDPSFDPSLTVRSTYGQSVPSLLDVDREWVMAHLEQIFPLERRLLDYFWSAWSSYLVFWLPHPQLFEVLSPFYRAAITLIGEEPDWRWLRDPSERLGEHLFPLYASGLAAYEEWLEPFFTRAGSELRHNLLAWVGQSLRQREEPDAETVERLLRVWELRVTHSGETDDMTELPAFGWWFTSDWVPTEWALDQLHAVLQRGVRVDADRDVVAKLSRHAGRSPRSVSRCLRLLVTNESQAWRVIGWSEALKGAINDLLASSDHDAVEETRATVAVLMMRFGLRDFHALLPDDSDTE